jgi:hypothetical protein
MTIQENIVIETTLEVMTWQGQPPKEFQNKAT